jgi:F-type H+-transporting ATPase subunit delta
MARRDSGPRRYADAAFEIALRDGTVDVWRRDLEAAIAIAASGNLERVLVDPSIPLEQRSDVARGAFASLSQPVLNLILLILRRGRINQLDRVASEFRRLDDERNGIIHASATSASPLAAGDIKALTTRVEELAGGKVALETAVDPALIGGLVVRIGDRLIDGSVRGRLERLRNQLASDAL